MGDIEISTLLTFMVTTTGKRVQIASDKENIEALVEALRPLVRDGLVHDGLIHELGQASHHAVRSDGTAIPGTTIYEPYSTVPRVS